MTRTAEEMNLVATTNARFEATIKEQANQNSKLIGMNNTHAKVIENAVH